MNKNISASYSIDDFMQLPYEKFISDLEDHYNTTHSEITYSQRKAWEKEYIDLNTNRVLEGLKGRVLFEYRIPGLPRVVDVVLLTEGKIYVIEYKAGADTYESQDLRQVNGYALRFKYFHNKSNDNWIVPILVATEAPKEAFDLALSEEDSVFSPVKCNSSSLREAILFINKTVPGSSNNEWEDSWENGIYKPSPTIISAARNVWKSNNVKGFQIGEADERTRLKAENYIVKTVIEETRKRKNGKSICFVTGVPGAGKTLVGLNVSIRLQDIGASMLSGNLPLVNVLTNALKYDLDKNKSRLIDSKNKAETSIESIIRSAYQYKEEIFDKRLDYQVGTGVVKLKENAEQSNQHVIIFDEAQRAWNKKKLIDPGQSRKKYWQEDQFPFSEPGLLLWDMNQRDWGVFICLVGGGQEINTGEAGICEWLRSIKENHEFDDWHIYMSDQFQGDEYNSKSEDGKTLDYYRQFFKSQNRLTSDSALHLKTGQRSNRTEDVASFVQALLECETEKARLLYDGFKDKYKIYITRDVDSAQQWLRKRHSKILDRAFVDGYDDEDIRIGMLMSSRAERLKPLGFSVFKVREFKDKIHKWFLEDDYNVLSSNFLELAMNEFFVQGLELDFTAVLWDADFRYDPKTNSWKYYKFDFRSCKRWSPVNKIDQEIIRFYMKNAYRVLLTRARAGMVIVVPKGSDLDERGRLVDPTRDPAYYDDTYRYLKSIIRDEI